MIVIDSLKWRKSIQWFGELQFVFVIKRQAEFRLRGEHALLRLRCVGLNFSCKLAYKEGIY